MARPKKVSTENMLALREQGLSNKEIAQKLGICYSTVFKHIGAQDANLTREIRQKTLKPIRTKVEEVARPVAETPPEPQKGPSEPLETSGVREVKNAPATPQKRKIIKENSLFDFARITNWAESLDVLARLAVPETWRFKKPTPACKNPDYQILEQYILQTFRFRVQEYNTTTDNPDLVIHMRGKFCCFHTGLYDRNLQGIYAYFVRSNPGTRQPWYFWRFVDPNSEFLMRVHPLPEHRTLGYELTAPFDPDKLFRVNISHITEREDRLGRFPEAVRGYWNLPLLVETAISYARRKAKVEPSTAVTIARIDQFVWLLPLFITNPDTPDIAAVVEDMGEYYHCRTCLTLEQAYLYARNNGRPTRSWLLTALVDANGGGELKGVTPTYGGEVRPHADPQTGVYGARRL